MFDGLRSTRPGGGANPAPSPERRATASCGVSWTGTAKNSDRATAGNWSDSAVPGASSAVCVGNEPSTTGPFTVTLTRPDHVYFSVASLTLGGTTAATLKADGVVLRAGGEIKSDGTLDLNSTLDLKGVKSGRAGIEPSSRKTLTVDAGGRVNTAGRAAYPVELGNNGATILNNGTVNAGAAYT